MSKLPYSGLQQGNQETTEMSNRANQIRFTVWNGDDEIEYVMPSRMEVCPRCDGTGSHTNPAIDGNGITSSEMAEMGDDFREDYMNGLYDVRCETCRGANVVPVADPANATAEVRAAWEQHEEAMYEAAREEASERWLRMAESGERY
jgi:hypothetical protein